MLIIKETCRTASRSHNPQSTTKTQVRAREEDLTSTCTITGVHSRIIAGHCSPDLDLLLVIYTPFYLPREITVVIVTTIYISHKMLTFAQPSPTYIVL